MGWDQELIEYIDYTFAKLDELKNVKGKEVRIPSDLYLACMSVIEPSKEHTVEDESMDMKKTDIIDMVSRAYMLIHASF